MKRILLVPSVRRNWGTGHLVRCSRLLASLGEQGWILLPEEDSEEAWGWTSLSKTFADIIPENRIVHSSRCDDPWDLVVFDRRKTEKLEFLDIARNSPTLGIDEGGEARPYFSYLVDGFPRIEEGNNPNLEDSGFVAAGLWKNPRTLPGRVGKVLLTFGGEDPASLTEKTFDAIVDSEAIGPEDIAVVEGPAFHRPFGRRCGRVFKGLTDLRQLLASYDLVFTSFGLTPYETLKEGSVPVLVNPSRYHERLAKKAGFLSLGIGRPNGAKLKAVLTNPRGCFGDQRKMRGSGETDPSSFVAALDTTGSRGCPVCGSRVNRAEHRQKEKSYFRCSKCGIAYLETFSGETTRYEKEYFFEEYRKQYGRTYLDDFERIRVFAKERLAELGKLSPGLTGKTILDVGCAYGPFLAEAGARGLFPYGVDVAEDAVEYVGNVLAIPAWRGDFLAFDPEEAFGVEGFDIVTLWYVIEHFRDLDAALRKISGILRSGGILALSTPNGKGISGRRKGGDFYRNSPNDHFSVWDPASAKSLLEKYGFIVKRVRVTGHHPERFPDGISKIVGERIRGMLSRALCLGDTFEAYAEKQ